MFPQGCVAGHILDMERVMLYSEWDVPSLTVGLKDMNRFTCKKNYLSLAWVEAVQNMGVLLFWFFRHKWAKLSGLQSDK